jgi:hypothetical protein
MLDSRHQLRERLIRQIELAPKILDRPTSTRRP